MSEKLVPIFRVADARSAASWYGRLGFEIAGEHRFAPTLPLYLFLRRGDEQLHLSEHTGDQKGPSLVYLWVDDVVAISEEFDTQVEQQPWAKEVKLTDPDGNRLRIGQVDSGAS